MRTNGLVVTIWLISTPVWGDMGFPGYTTVPRDLVIEVEKDVLNYHIFLQSPLGLEPILTTPKHAARIDGKGRYGSARIAYLIAVPQRIMEQRGDQDLTEWLQPRSLPEGVLRSQIIDFRTDVPFYDSRDRVVDHYLLEIDEIRGMKLLWLRQNEASQSMKVGWLVAGLSMMAAILWLTWRLFRHRSVPA